MTVRTVAKIIGGGWLILIGACTVAILTGCSDSTAPVIQAPALTIQDYVAALNTKVDSLYRQGKTVRYGVINLCDSCPPYLVLQQTSR